MKFLSVFLLGAVFSFVLGGCKDNSNPTAPNTPGSTSYVGVIAGTGVSGTLAITIPTAKRAFAETATAGDSIAITAIMKINGGATVSLAGFYIISTHEVVLAGGGYVFVGSLATGSVTGTFTYAGGTGLFICKEGAAGSVKSYCGTYQENTPGTGTGAFNLTVSGATLVVVVYPSDAGGQSFMTTGSINPAGQISIYDPNNTAIVVATGTLNTSTNTVSGAFGGDPGGTWSGGLCH
jgi:hypothetical protein